MTDRRYLKFNESSPGRKRDKKRGGGGENKKKITTHTPGKKNSFVLESVSRVDFIRNQQ